MNKIAIAIITLSIIFFPKINLATIVTSNGAGGGAWGTDDSWMPGAPQCGDTVYILAGDVITIETQQDYSEPGCTSPMFIIIDGTLDFSVEGMKLRLPCNSGVIINAGGLLTSSAGGGGSSNFLEICGSIVWKKSDGDVKGPAILGTPLPITLISFDAEIDNTSVKLIWATSSEINNNFFTIERSENGLAFENIAEISGSGNSNTTKTYEQYDDSPLIGTSYYRLKQTDFDGKFEYVDILAITFNKDDDGICTLHVYPNPCIGSCTINLKDCPLEDNQVDVELYDAFGKKITHRITPKSRNQDISFHLNSSNNLAPGIYIVRAYTNGKNQASKVIIK